KSTNPTNPSSDNLTRTEHSLQKPGHSRRSEDKVLRCAAGSQQRREVKRRAGEGAELAAGFRADAERGGHVHDSLVQTNRSAEVAPRRIYELRGAASDAPNPSGEGFCVERLHGAARQTYRILRVQRIPVLSVNPHAVAECPLAPYCPEQFI